MKFSNLFMETHYTDMYGKSFFDFKKQYNKLKKENLYVNFSDFAGDPMDKSIHESPDHSDPAGVYAYPLRYVIDYPADVWYGRNSKYLRVLKPKKLESLHLQYDFNDIASVHLYLKKCGIPQKMYYIEFIQKAFGLKNNPSDYAKLFFKFIQINFDNVGETINKTNKFDVSYDNLRPSVEQTALLRNAGIHMVIDSAKSASKAVINNREPEQIIFLTPQSFDIIDVFEIGGRFFRGGKRIPSEGKTSGGLTDRDKRKIVQTISESVFNDKISEDIDNKKFWTVGGRRIEIHEGYTEQYMRTHKLGEKKHRESKQHTQEYVLITINCEYGFFEIKSSIDDDVYDIIHKIKQAISGKSVLRDWEKETKQSYLKKEKEDTESAWAIQREKSDEKKFLGAKKLLFIMNEFFKKHIGRSLDIEIKNDVNYVTAFEYSCRLVVHNIIFSKPMKIDYAAIARHININSEIEDDKIWITGQPIMFIADDPDTYDYIHDATQKISMALNEIFEKYPDAELDGSNPFYSKHIDIFINDVGHQIDNLNEGNSNE